MSTNKIELAVQAAFARPSTGLSDGGHVYLSCSNCKAGLMDFWITRPNEIDPGTGKVVEWNVQCNCPFCGDESFQKNIKGGFYPAGYGIPKPGGAEDDVIASTIWEKCDPEESVLKFRVLKAKKDAKPYKVRD